MLSMLKVLVRIASHLSESTDRAGFVLVDPVDASGAVNYDPDDQAAVQMLCYRHSIPSQLTILIELCHIPQQRWITATIWRPEDLAALRQACSVDEVALCHRFWTYYQTTDPDALASEIASAVTDWLDEFSRGKPSPPTTDG